MTLPMQPEVPFWWDYGGSSPLEVITPSFIEYTPDCFYSLINLFLRYFSRSNFQHLFFMTAWTTGGRVYLLSTVGLSIIWIISYDLNSTVVAKLRLRKEGKRWLPKSCKVLRLEMLGWGALLKPQHHVDVFLIYCALQWIFFYFCNFTFLLYCIVLLK